MKILNDLKSILFNTRITQNFSGLAFLNLLITIISLFISIFIVDSQEYMAYLILFILPCFIHALLIELWSVYLHKNINYIKQHCNLLSLLLIFLNIFMTVISFPGILLAFCLLILFKILITSYKTLSMILTYDFKQLTK